MLVLLRKLVFSLLVVIKIILLIEIALLLVDGIDFKLLLVSLERGDG